MARLGDPNQGFYRYDEGKIERHQQAQRRRMPFRLEAWIDGAWVALAHATTARELVGYCGDERRERRIVGRDETIVYYFAAGQVAA